MKNNNRVLILTHTDINSDSRILKEMEAIKKIGFIVSGIGIAIEQEKHKTNHEFQNDLVTLVLRSRCLTFLPKTMRHIIVLLELMFKMLPMALRQKPHIVHCHDTLVLPLGVLVKLFTKAKLIYDAHELESNRNGLTKIQSKLTLWVEKILWRYIDRLIVVSPSIDKWYQLNLGYKESEVILNSPVLNKSEFIDKNYLREKFNIDKNKKIFIYVGILGYGRGIDLVLDVFKNDKVNSKIVFLGYGDLSEEINELSKTYENIHLHEAVPHSMVVPIVSSADYGLCLIQNVSLSDYYCLPNKLFEYCFAGVPVLASDFPDLRAVIDEYKLGSYCDLDSNSLLKKVIELQSKTDGNFVFKDLMPLSWQAQELKLQKMYKNLV